MPESVVHRYLRMRALLSPLKKWYFARWLRKLTRGRNISYISLNCIGGRFYQLETRKYTSPTAGLGFLPDEYIKFCSNLEWYLAQDVTYDADESKVWGYPVGRIGGDVRILFTHYFTFAGAVLAWKKRAARVNLDDIVLIADVLVSQGFDGFVEDFLNLPFSNKMLLTDRQGYPDDRVIYLPEYGRRDYPVNLYGEFEVLAEKPVMGRIAACMARRDEPARAKAAE